MGDKKDEEKEAGDQEYTFRTQNVEEKLKKAIIEAYKKCKNLPSLPKITEGMKNELDKRLSKGWIVFAGKHLVGSCVYIQGTMVEFEANGSIFVVFQTFCPKNPKKEG